MGTLDGSAVLEGTLVLELGDRVGVSVCGSLLAQLGATVVFAENTAPAGSSTKWACREQFAAGKLSVRLDRDTPADRALLESLLARADIILVSPDIDRIAVPRPPRAVVCEITAYGSTGPDAGRTDDELEIQARTGIIDTTGNAGSQPVAISTPVVEYQAGSYAAAALLAALRCARSSGQGQTVEIALYDCAFAAMATFLPGLLSGTSNTVNRIGNRHAMISPWNVFRASDGWLLICAGSDQQWQRLTQIMDRGDLGTDPRLGRIADRVQHSSEVDAAVQAWAAGNTVEQCLEVLSKAQVACGPVVEISQHPAEPNLHERGMIVPVTDRATGNTLFVPGSPLSMSRSPGRAPQSIPAPDGDRDAVQRFASAEAVANRSSEPLPARPLAGIRVVEIGHYTTVPLCTKHLGALGAEVIKIEPPEGEATREWPPVQGRQGYFFTYMNSDKKSITLDLRTDEGAEALWQLIEGADVLIENLKPGALAKRGFSYEKLSARNPRLIYAGVSGFGVRSLYPGRPAFDTVIQAMSGIMDVVRSDGVPMKTGISIADLMGAIVACVTVIAAIVHRDRSGLGQSIDLSMQDIAAWMTQTAWNGRGAAARLPSVVPCADGHIVVEGDLPGDASTHGMTRSAAVAFLQERGVTASAVLTTAEMLRLPQTAARRLWFQAAGDEFVWPLLDCPMRLSRTPARVEHPMPALGRDNARILGSPSATAPKAVISS
jgi:crotonobetainyl-CoA:carnitine CoA-transferase CaiB-like acyl-CoA transferase